MRGLPERIQLKTPDQITLMREAGLVVARALAAMRDAAAPGVSTADLDGVARGVLSEAGATPSFLGYHGYPAVICASVNDRVVHGIPSTGEKLREGDLVSIDFGAIVEGWHGDAAISVAIGEVAPDVAALSAACEKSMWDGLAVARSGARLTDISHAVETSIRGSGTYGIVAGYGGHGIGSEMHMAPHILNYGRPGKGPRLTPGMALAIEPMVTLGSRATEELDDGWTVVTTDGSWAAHWEHTVAILEDGPWVLTAEDGGRAELAARGIELSAAAA
ncbi:MAG TPA: type I methionyl aminopeptidase [Jatrophihabitans sp.]|jgi:methionyl aminopeptidase|uniref:type I methionyl aminopeptidase n=1 Tax=Jatrophihabitans sp. TaxID=1932789 RepID=UPI002E044858|nr:type I methionyl aminopeptidase [Jatrophihabitans sp.]